MKICILIFIITTSFLSISQTVVMNAGVNNTTVSTCSAVLFDSGGMGGTGYSDNETTVITFCPATPGDYISLAFNLLLLKAFAPILITELGIIISSK